MEHNELQRSATLMGNVEQNVVCLVHKVFFFFDPLVHKFSSLVILQTLSQMLFFYYSFFGINEPIHSKSVALLQSH